MPQTGFGVVAGLEQMWNVTFFGGEKTYWKTAIFSLACLLLSFMLCPEVTSQRIQDLCLNMSKCPMSKYSALYCTWFLRTIVCITGTSETTGAHSAAIP